MIKTPGSHTDRIAQACDRCRSKKIRCDGKRPHCSQCLAVGFECKTSDKLSRRAFPRGYTESLEDRVRQLESENNKLLNLLDIKDEQMEMLAKVESVNVQTAPKLKKSDPAEKLVSAPGNPQAASTPPQDESEEDEEAYFVHQINTLSPEGTYRGSAAGGVFIDAFLEKLKPKYPSMIPQLTSLFDSLNTPYSHDPNTGSSQLTSKNLLQHQLSTSPPRDAPTPMTIPITPASSTVSPLSPASSAYGGCCKNSASSFFVGIDLPGRLTLDKLISTYFHEWNTMHAILDQYDFLERYQSFMNTFSAAEATNNFDGPDFKGNELFIIITLMVASLGSIALKDKSALAVTETWRLEREWKRLFTPEFQTTPSLLAVQALVLAELYSLHIGNQDDVWHYRMMASSMCQRLGLHRCHKSLKLQNGKQLSFYEQEMRRRVFWVAYTLDCFSSALLGAPRLLNDRDIECAVPSNINDEIMRNPEAAAPADDDHKAEGTANTTQMTCPLSVIHFAKVFGNILDTIYSCCKKSHPYKTIVMLEDMLEQWRRDLPPELKFEFANGMPAATLVPLHQKSPLLLIMYHYARVLIHIPAISSQSLGSNAGTRGSASCVAVMQSSKVVIQVMNYLKARCVIPCLSMNTSRFTVFFGAIVLYGAVDYSRGGALLLDIRKIMSSAITHLYSDLQLHRPGSLNLESYQMFEEVCDTLLNSTTKKNSDAGTRKRRTTKRRDSKNQNDQTDVSTPSTNLPTPGASSVSPPETKPVPILKKKSVPSPTINTNISLPTLAPAPLPTPSPTEGNMKHCLSSVSSDSSVTSSSSRRNNSIHIKMEPGTFDSNTTLSNKRTNTPPIKMEPVDEITVMACLPSASKNQWTNDVQHLRTNAINDLLMINSMASSSSRSSSTSVSTLHTKTHNSPAANNVSNLHGDALPILNPMDLFFDSGVTSNSKKSESTHNSHSSSGHLSPSASFTKLTESLVAMNDSDLTQLAEQSLYSYNFDYNNRHHSDSSTESLVETHYTSSAADADALLNEYDANMSTSNLLDFFSGNAGKTYTGNSTVHPHAQHGSTNVNWDSAEVNVPGLSVNWTGFDDFHHSL